MEKASSYDELALSGVINPKRGEINKLVGRTIRKGKEPYSISR